MTPRCGATPDEWGYLWPRLRRDSLSPLKQIRAENVSQLGLGWSWETRTDGGIESTPWVSKGVLYVTGRSVVFAIDARIAKSKSDDKIDQTISVHPFLFRTRASADCGQRTWED